MTLKVLVVDDEPPARERLRQLVDEEDGFRVIDEAANGAQAVEKAAAADIVILDIRMPGMDGLEAAQHINTLDEPPAIVFATAYDEYAIDAFDARALGYVLKPVRRARLKAALEQAARVSGKALREMRGGASRRAICATAHGEMRVIPIETIDYFCADQKYVSVVHESGTDLIDESLKSLEDEFAERFVRIHRSAIVAVDRIERIERRDDGRTVVVLRDRSDDNALTISRRHVADVRRRLKDAAGGAT